MELGHLAGIMVLHRRYGAVDKAALQRLLILQLVEGEILVVRGGSRRVCRKEAGKSGRWGASLGGGRHETRKSRRVHDDAMRCDDALLGPNHRPSANHTATITLTQHSTIIVCIKHLVCSSLSPALLYMVLSNNAFLLYRYAMRF